MKLSQWKTKNNLTNHQIADSLSMALGYSISHETVRLHVNETRMPRRNEMRAYSIISDGEVMANDFYDLPPAEASAMQGAEVAG